MKPVLVTGATGFVGRHLRVALRAAGLELRLGTRSPEEMERRDPGNHWVKFDTDDADCVRAALAGCGSAFFLVHQVGARRDYAATESAAARRFIEAAGTEGLERVVYLGGVAPEKALSRHLRSRKKTGEILRSGPVSCVELRAAMVIGNGSASWKMVRELADRLPAMVLPRWLANHSWPIGIDDVVYALLAALLLHTDSSCCFDVPGAERVSHRDMLLRVAEALGHHPVMMGVPVLSPRLSSYWIGLVTSVDFGLARELVEGLVTDLDPSEEVFWERLERKPAALDKAVSLALADADSMVVPSATTRQRLEAIGASFTSEVPAAG